MWQTVKMFKALGDEVRWRILKIVQAQPCCVCVLTEILGITQPCVSRHLRILKEAELLEDIRQGQLIFYRLLSASSNPETAAMLKFIKSLGNYHPTVKKDRARARDQAAKLALSRQ